MAYPIEAFTVQELSEHRQPVLSILVHQIVLFPNAAARCNVVYPAEQLPSFNGLVVRTKRLSWCIDPRFCPSYFHLIIQDWDLPKNIVKSEIDACYCVNLRFQNIIIQARSSAYEFRHLLSRLKDSTQHAVIRDDLFSNLGWYITEITYWASAEPK